MKNAEQEWETQEKHSDFKVQSNQWHSDLLPSRKPEAVCCLSVWLRTERETCSKPKCSVTNHNRSCWVWTSVSDEVKFLHCSGCLTFSSSGGLFRPHYLVVVLLRWLCLRWSPGRHRARNPSSFHSSLWWSRCVLSHCRHRSEGGSSELTVDSSFRKQKFSIRVLYCSFNSKFIRK